MKKAFVMALALVFVVAAAFVVYGADSKKTGCPKMDGTGMGMGQGMGMGGHCGMGGCPMMGDDREVTVKDTADGVVITIKAKDKAKVKEIQEQAKKCAAMKQGAAPANKDVAETTLDGSPDDMVTCPVMKTQMKKKNAYKVLSYKGKKYYMCCAPCVSRFTQDPEKYAK